MNMSIRLSQDYAGYQLPPPSWRAKGVLSPHGSMDMDMEVDSFFAQDTIESPGAYDSSPCIEVKDLTPQPDSSEGSDLFLKAPTSMRSVDIGSARSSGIFGSSPNALRLECFEYSCGGRTVPKDLQSAASTPGMDIDVLGLAGDCFGPFDY